MHRYGTGDLAEICLSCRSLRQLSDLLDIEDEGESFSCLVNHQIVRVEHDSGIQGAEMSQSLHERLHKKSTASVRRPKTFEYRSVKNEVVQVGVIRPVVVGFKWTDQTLTVETKIFPDKGLVGSSRFWFRIGNRVRMKIWNLAEEADPPSLKGNDTEGASVNRPDPTSKFQ